DPLVSIARRPARQAGVRRGSLEADHEEAPAPHRRRVRHEQPRAEREAARGAARARRDGERMTSARSAFLPLWTLAVMATVSAFVVHLALRGRTVQLGYELGRVRQEQAHLREVRRVLELESASYKTPERVEIVARTLLGMEP